jgi:hypothetical protein
VQLVAVQVLAVQAVPLAAVRQLQGGQPHLQPLRRLQQWDLQQQNLKGWETKPNTPAASAAAVSLQALLQTTAAAAKPRAGVWRQQQQQEQQLRQQGPGERSNLGGTRHQQQGQVRQQQQQQHQPHRQHQVQQVWVVYRQVLYSRVVPAWQIR